MIFNNFYCDYYQRRISKPSGVEYTRRKIQSVATHHFLHLLHTHYASFEGSANNEFGNPRNQERNSIEQRLIESF